MSLSWVPHGRLCIYKWARSINTDYYYIIIIIIIINVPKNTNLILQ